MKTKTAHKTHVSKKKIEGLSEITKLAKEKRTILIASIKNIPLSQYQEISKKLRGKAVVKVPKKSIIFRMLDSLKEKSAEEFKERIHESTAVLFSDMDAFDLAAELVNKRSPAKAKTGQEATSDIEIPAGPTDLVPGPAISELGALGIQIQIDKGKISIKEPKVITKKGEKITAAAADVMSKLGIKPFTIGFVPLAALDTKEKKVYSEIRIDREGTVNEIKSAFAKALPFAVAIGYASPETIKFLIQKAGRQELAMEAIANKHSNASHNQIHEHKEENSENKSNSEENK
jgi:large subunit ribosomal protein L10